MLYYVIYQGRTVFKGMNKKTQKNPHNVLLYEQSSECESQIKFGFLENIVLQKSAVKALQAMGFHKACLAKNKIIPL